MSLVLREKLSWSYYVKNGENGLKNADVHILRLSNMLNSTRVCFPNGPKEHTTGGGGSRLPSSARTLLDGQ